MSGSTGRDGHISLKVFCHLPETHGKTFNISQIPVKWELLF